MHSGWEGDEGSATQKAAGEIEASKGLRFPTYLSSFHKVHVVSDKPTTKITWGLDSEGQTARHASSAYIRRH
jgi:hypothetical protein